MMELQRMGDVGGGLGWRSLDEKAEGMIRLMMGQLSAHTACTECCVVVRLPCLPKLKVRTRRLPPPTIERKLREKASASSAIVAVVADSCIPHLGHTIRVHLV